MRAFCLLALLVVSPARAEVVSSGPNAFEVRQQVTVQAAPRAVYDRIGRIGGWWNPEHSYSGKPENLSLELKAGGCFCETLANGGSVEHMRVVYADPDHGVRLQGALGPLQIQAVAGTLSWSFKPVAGGTEITQDYLVAGSLRDGGEALAKGVDMVLGDQLARLAAGLKP